MSKRVYISADYSVNNGDRDVVDEMIIFTRLTMSIPPR